MKLQEQVEMVDSPIANWFLIEKGQALERMKDRAPDLHLDGAQEFVHFLSRDKVRLAFPTIVKFRIQTIHQNLTKHNL